ncbi:MAG: competence/damage-inducible protein A [Luteitalea sp.]|nr:competence/damage-inducible protein A [Luteitalea sp.]
MRPETSIPLQRASIVAVGTELLTGVRHETLGEHVACELLGLGIETVSRTVVPDDLEEIGAALKHALARADLVVATGGLGPSDDDLTRQAVAHVLGRELDEHQEIVDAIQARFAARGSTMAAVNRRQALLVRGAAVLPNEHGTAPGQWIELERQVIALLPGPPRELMPMLAVLVGGRLAARAPLARTERRTLSVTGLTESQVEQVMQPLYARWRGQPIAIAVTTLASPGLVELHLRASSDSAPAAARVLDEASADAAEVLGNHLFSNGTPLEAVVGDLLRARGYRIAVAESCTGGMLAGRLTDVAGSSAYVERGVVTYSNAAKVELAGVDPRLIEHEGAVSEPVALAMARGIRERAQVEVGVSVTGIAGPTGATPAKRVGDVVIAIDMPGGADVRTLRFAGSRYVVRAQAVQAALDLVRRGLAP